MRFKVLFCVLSCAVAFKLDAQVVKLDKSNFRQVFKFDVASAIGADRYTLAFEQVITQKASLQLAGGVYAYQWNYTTPVDFQNHTLNGWMLRPEFRRYLQEFVGEDAPHSAYFSVFAFADEQESALRGHLSAFPNWSSYLGVGDWYDIESSERYYGAGVSLGAQFFFPRGVGLEFAVDGMLGYYFTEYQGVEGLYGDYQPYYRKSVDVVGRTGFRISAVYGLVRN